MKAATTAKQIAAKALSDELVGNFFHHFVNSNFGGHRLITIMCAHPLFPDEEGAGQTGGLGEGSYCEEFLQRLFFVK
jgi:hypothetical protein